MGLEGCGLVELSGEHPNLPLAELWGGLTALGVRPAEAVVAHRVVAYRPRADPKGLATRLALARFAGTVRVAGTLSEIEERARKLDLRGHRFRVRAHDPESAWDTSALEARVGRSLAATGRVDLEAPDMEFRLVRFTPACLYVVEGAVDRGAFQARRAEERPFSRPVGLHPRLARALINLAGVAEGATLLDPFCGAGGILIEAAQLGIQPIGSDSDPEMVEGARENLIHYGASAALHVCDVGSIGDVVGPVETIVTDPPYGRAAGTQGEAVASLLERAFATFAQVLPPRGRLAIALPRREYIALGRRSFRLLQWHALPVHRSLVRFLTLFERD